MSKETPSEGGIQKSFIINPGDLNPIFGVEDSNTVELTDISKGEASQTRNDQGNLSIRNHWGGVDQTKRRVNASLQKDKIAYSDY